MKKAFYYLCIGFITLFAIVVFCTALYRALFVASNDSGLFPPSIHTALTANTDLPVRLYIPSIAVDAQVEYVALSKSGAVGTPSNFTNVAWYEYSPVPGSIGNAIIDGHRDNALDLPGVFSNINALEIGDDIYVITAKEGRLHFKVTKTISLPANAPSAGEIFKDSTTANLVLITCTGDWDAARKQYSDRLVVFSTLVP